MTNAKYPERLPVYDTEEGIRLLKGLADKWQCSAAAAIRRMIREAARREKVE